MRRLLVPILSICSAIVIWQTLMQLPVCYSQAKVFSDAELCEIVLRRLPDDLRAGIARGQVDCRTRRRPDGIASEFDRFVFWWLGVRVYRVIVSRPLTTDESNVQTHYDPITRKMVWRGQGASASVDLDVCAQADRSYEN